MLAIDITSASNDRFKTWKKVSASPRAIRKEGFTLAEGLHLAMAAVSVHPASAADQGRTA